MSSQAFVVLEIFGQLSAIPLFIVVLEGVFNAIRVDAPDLWVEGNA